MQWHANSEDGMPLTVVTKKLRGDAIVMPNT